MRGQALGLDLDRPRHLRIMSISLSLITRRLRFDQTTTEFGDRSVSEQKLGKQVSIMHEQLLAVKKQRSAAVSAREAAEFARNRDFCIQASKRKDAEAEEKSLIVIETLQTGRKRQGGSLFIPS